MAVPEALVLADTGAQRSHGPAYLPDDAAQPLAQHLQLQGLLGRGRLGQDVVDEIAEGCHLLRDAVVHLAREPAALLGGRRIAERREEQGGVEVDRRGLEACGERRPGCGGGPGRPGPARGRGSPETTATVPAPLLSGNAKAESSTSARSGAEARAARSSASPSSGALPPWSLMIGVSCSPRGTCTTSAADGQLVVNGAGDAGRQGDRLETRAEAAGEADQLADQRLSGAVGVEGVRGSR